jgi:N-acetylglutamate synthase-like GNAT family acetyltransferase
MAAPVRPATARDLDAIVALIEQGRLELTGLGEAKLWVVDGGSGRPAVGLVGLEARGGVGLLGSLTVRADQRRRGLGRALVDQALAHAGAQHLSAVYALTTTAGGAFERWGFRSVEREALPAALHGCRQVQADACADAQVYVRPLL